MCGESDHRQICNCNSDAYYSIYEGNYLDLRVVWGTSVPLGIVDGGGGCFAIRSGSEPKVDRGGGGNFRLGD